MKKVILKKLRYATGTVMFRAFSEEGEPWHTLTKNFDELDKDEIALDVLYQDWSREQLLKEELIMPGHIREIQSGYCVYKVYALSERGLNISFDSDY